MTDAPFARAETIAAGSELLAFGRTDTNSGVIADRLGHGADQDVRLVGDAGGVELLLRRGKHRLAFLGVVALQLALGQARHARHRQVHGHQLDCGLFAIPVAVLDKQLHRLQRRLRAVDGYEDPHT